MSCSLPLKLSVQEKGLLVGPAASGRWGPYDETSDQKFALGTKWVFGDGRIFRYFRNGATALAKALMTQTQVVETKLLEIPQTAHAQVVGATNINVLVTTASAIVKDALVGGTMWCNKIANMGESYRIIASELDTTDTILHLTLETPIRAAIGATTEVSLCPNPWYKVVVFPTSATGMATGVPLVSITAAYYGWLQTGGDCPLTVDSSETAVVGNLCGLPAADAVAGAGGVWQTLFPPWGVWRTVNAADEIGIVYLILDN